jgi:hypothetical protein
MESAMKNLSLPEPIAEYFEADKRDGDAVVRCFAHDAVVKDEGRVRTGLAEISAWKAETSAKYSYVAEPIALEKNDRTYIVTSRVTGDFPGSPVDLRFIFTLGRGKIASLEIAP